MINYVTRAEWGAAPPSAPLQNIATPTPVIYIHHSASTAQGNAAVREFQRFHMTTKGMRDIAYSFLIGDQGEVYVGRGAGKAHGGNTGEDNRISHSICFMGNFEKQVPTKAAEQAAIELMARGKTSGWWLLTDARGHRSEPGASTACPGRNLFVRIPALVAAARTYNATAPTPPTPPTLPEEIDMNTEYIFDCHGKPGLYFVNGTIQTINADQRDLLRSVDVPARKLSPEHYAAALNFPHAD